MARYYLQYRLELKEPLIMSSGSQIGNVLETLDYIPGSAMLGLSANLYIRSGKAALDSNKKYTREFRSLFLSDGTIFSPAYPLIRSKGVPCFPMPLSVFGCKYYGTKESEGSQPAHGFQDYLYHNVPDRCEMVQDGTSCHAALEHKQGFCYGSGPGDRCFDHNVERQILSHNQVGEKDEEKSLYSFESLREGQQFHGEISFSSEQDLEIIKELFNGGTLGKLGKAKNRGYGQVEFFTPDCSDQSPWREFEADNLSGPIFSIYLLSDAILVDDNLNYLSAPDAKTLGFWMGLPNEDIKRLHVHLSPKNGYKSFWRTKELLGFNAHRGMPLPKERVISKGSVFTCTFDGDKNVINTSLKKLRLQGLGLRRNEGFGMVIINHKIHSYPLKKEELK